MIKAVVFDLEGVFFEGGTKNFFTKLQEKWSLTIEDILSVYTSKSEMMQKYKRGEIDSNEYWNYAIKEWGIESTVQEMIELVLSSYTLEEGKLELVKQLKENGYKVGVCTNNYRDRLEGLFDRLKLSGIFDVVVASYMVGVKKPEKEIFNQLARELELLPSEIFMTDDKQSNVDGLNENGFHGHLYTSLGGLKKDLTEIEVTIS